MTHSLRGSRSGWLGFLPYALVTLLPAGLLLVRSILAAFFQPFTAGTLFSWQRESLLLLKTVAYASGVAATVCLVGFLAAVYVCGPGRRQIRPFLVLLLVSLTIPTSVHAMGWLKWLSVLRQTGLREIPGRGWVVSWVVQSMAMLPIACLIIAGGMLIQNREQFQAARLLGPDSRFLFRLLPGLIRPQILTAGAIVLILTLNDYAIPSIFSINTYAIEVFVEYSSSYSLVRTVLKSLPLALVQTTVLAAILGYIPDVFLTGRQQDIQELRFRFPVAVNGLAFFGPVLAGLQVVIPLSVILLQKDMWNELVSTVIRSTGDYLTSLLISTLAVLAAIPLAFQTARWLKTRPVSRMTLFWVLLPAAIPGTLTGVALISLFNHRLTNGLYNSLLMPVLAILGRFLPFATIVALAWLKRIDQQLLWSASLLEAKDSRNTLKILLPLAFPGLVFGSALVFLLGLGELSATVLVVPPGLSTLTIRLYNYLHYGATERVLGLSFLILVTIALVLVLLARIPGRKSS